MCERVTIGFGLTSDWMKKWRELLRESCSVLWRSQFLLKTALSSATRYLTMFLLITFSCELLLEILFHLFLVFPEFNLFSVSGKAT